MKKVVKVWFQFQVRGKGGQWYDYGYKFDTLKRALQEYGVWRARRDKRCKDECRILRYETTEEEVDSYVHPPGGK